MISIYVTCYNLLSHGFTGWDKNLKNACQFADEVVIAVNTSDDGTEDAIRDALWEHKNWKIISANFSKLDPLYDGRLKNLALQHCTGEFKIQLDADEYIPIWQKPLWENALFQLKFSGAKVLAVPSVDLYKTLDGYKAVNYKTYAHIGQAWRGPAGGALKPGYFINTQISDGTELINEQFQPYGPAITSGPCDIQDLESGGSLFVVHEGYLNIDERIERTKKFWGQHWLQESNGTLPAHKIHHDESTFSHYEYKKHNLKL